MSPSSTAPTMEQNFKHNAQTEEIADTDLSYIIQDVPGKGKGMLATRPIPKGTLILNEAPLFTTENISSESDLRALIKTLPKSSQKAFLFLHNAFPGEPNPFIHIVRSNAYPLGPSSETGAIFPTIARINHSCLPNSQHSWNPLLQKEVVYSLFDIAKGEEITLSYHPGGPSSERKSELKASFNFTCTCTKCSLPPPLLKISDARMLRAKSLDMAIGNSKRIKTEPEVVLSKCKMLLQIFEDEGIRDMRVPRVYFDAFQICVMHSDAARASVFVGRYRAFKVGSEGGDSVGVGEVDREGWVRRPEGHGSWGLTQRWRSCVGDVPGGLGEEEFEKWLWRES